MGRLGCFYLLNYCVNILISGWCLTIRVSIQGVKLNHFDPNFSDYMVHSYLRMRILTFYPTKQVRRGFFPPMHRYVRYPTIFRRLPACLREDSAMFCHSRRWRQKFNCFQYFINVKFCITSLRSEFTLV